FYSASNLRRARASVAGDRLDLAIHSVDQIAHEVSARRERSSPVRKRATPSAAEPVRRLTRTEARRIAIRAQLLDAARPRDLVAMVSQLTFLQLDPTAVVAPSADLVAWSRLGNAYTPAQLQDALERDRTLFEHRAQPTEVEPPLAIVRPMADLGLFLADMAAWVRGRDAPGRMGARERC